MYIYIFIYLFIFTNKKYRTYICARLHTHFHEPAMHLLFQK